MSLDQWFVLALAVVLYLCAGAVVLLIIDGCRRWWAVLDRLTAAQELLVLVLWPFALPLLVLRHGPRR